MDLGHGTHGGTGIPAGGLLVDGDGRREAFDQVHFRFVHLAQELPRIGGQTFYVFSLALCIDGVKGQGGLSGAGQPRQHHHLVPGDVHIDVLQIVSPGAPDDYLIVFHHCLFLV